EAAQLAADRARIAAQLAAREATAAARAAGRAALSGPGHAAARAVLADIDRRRRTSRRGPVSRDTNAQP
ncbi:helix-turn-helix domain-containing protein, partial [Mycobacterium kansasii]